MGNFEELGLLHELVQALKKQQINKPTEIQEKIIPLVMEKKDVIAQSQTGSGKTLAYLLPIISNLDFNSKSLQAIVLTPTHELALQVERQLKVLIQNSKLPLRTAVIIGSVNIARQIEKLKEKPHIVVGSYGRILELISKKKMTGHTVKTIVIDEADRMLDEKNIDGVKAVIKTTLKDRQLVMVSATMSEKSLDIAKEMMKEPEFVQIRKKEALPDTIKHMYFLCERRDKIDMLRKIIRSENPQRTIVFINNPNDIETTIEKLEYHKLKATAIYGLANKMERKQAMDDFISGRKPILVSSDLGSRGLDIEGVTHIISLDIPEEPVFYLHRAGRTGRAGKEGISISIVTKNEEHWLRKYEKRFNIKINKKELSYGKIEESKKNVKSDKEKNDKFLKKSTDNKKKNDKMFVEKKQFKDNKEFEFKKSYTNKK